MSRILITGAGGFIGSHVARHFAAQGADVKTDAKADGASARIELSAITIATHLDGWQPDAIVHAAGSGTVGLVTADPQRLMPANLAATLGVLGFAREFAPETHVVFVSSAAVYGNAPDQPQRERDRREPVSLYGLSKLQSEQLLTHYSHQHGLQTTAVRLFSVYGSGLRKQLLWDAMNKFKSGQSEFFGTGNERRDWIHVEDVCLFMEHLLAKSSRDAFEIYNCAGSAATTSEVLSTLAETAGASAPNFNGQSRAGDPLSLIADCSKARAELGWASRISWRDGIAEYAKWFNANAFQPLPISSR